MKIQKIILADNALKRLKGLLGHKRLVDGEGLLLCECKAIHTLFMKFPIHVFFIDENYQVIGVEKNVKPWSRSKYYSHAYYVLETNTSDYTYQLGDKIIEVADWERYLR